MSHETQSPFAYVAALGMLIVALFVLTNTSPSPAVIPETIPESAQTASVAPANIAPSPTPTANKEGTEPAPSKEPAPQKAALPAASSNEEKKASSVVRIQDPYPFPPQSFLTVNESTRAALVNILCTTEGDVLLPTSGSGVIIDPRGVILTNAHVAQYVLLAESERVNLSCTIRSGAPAHALWIAKVLYIPSIWVQEHAADITTTDPTGTGEHDYALLVITGPLDPSAPKLNSLPFLPIDTREAIGFPHDSVLAASYPAEFVGPAATQLNLHPASSITSVRELLTFGEDTVDLLSLGGVAEAQSGSSGGPVVNAWGRLIGIITTTSEGATTADRELRALTLSYIDRDITAQTGLNLSAILGTDVHALVENFTRLQAAGLADLLIGEIAKRQQR
ncbi:hypothetical protein A2853_01190 [Candidatus Kaiserbacteria bacterium RIFCSPHIGHO2_01_FULL_55_17]|uniref:Serine protease n=1 Tax=Candidatus Kaiserbacteria bacterium RIFCSPHIGHO2_01_FULL_55_17 TaxID=1798484 RepID=A0A1F6D9J6_9BACT|nr:MAG: hypothetical protein A2853_01190 [Candidatus Kaiserbacteria bacterium RIFCSPHIGHO2_01_FULL_55_17]